MENKIFIKDGIKHEANTGSILTAEPQLQIPATEDVVVPEKIIPAEMGVDEEGKEIIIVPEQIIEEHIIPGDPAVYGYNRIYNPTENQLIDNGWVEYEDTLEEAIAKVIAEIDEYDTSDKVNTFSIAGEPVEWVSLTNRMGIKYRYEGKEADYMCTVSFGIYSFELPKAQLDGLLEELEDYAGECWDVTAAHKQAVSNLTTKEDVIAYDFKANYPTPLNFNL